MLSSCVILFAFDVFLLVGLFFFAFVLYFLFSFFYININLMCWIGWIVSIVSMKNIYYILSYSIKSVLFSLSKSR